MQKFRQCLVRHTMSFPKVFLVNLTFIIRKRCHLTRLTWRWVCHREGWGIFRPSKNKIILMMPITNVRLLIAAQWTSKGGGC
jgi:hypothetical protein